MADVEAIHLRYGLSFRTNWWTHFRHRHGGETDAVAVGNSRLTVGRLAVARSVSCTDVCIDPYMMVTCSSLTIIIEMGKTRT